MKKKKLSRAIREIDAGLKKRKLVKKRVEGGIGYELYAKGLDRISVQCNTISIAAKDLAKLVRENAKETKKKKALKELTKWVNVLNKEMEGIESDISNLEGYPSE